MSIVTVKKDPRFAGVRLCFKGIAIFVGSSLVLCLSAILGDGAPPSFIVYICLPVALFGFVVAIDGMFKHYKIMFGPIDPKREVDPGYDFDRLLCPHCKKVEIRVEASAVKCPICKTTTRV